MVTMVGGRRQGSPYSSTFHVIFATIVIAIVIIDIIKVTLAFLRFDLLWQSRVMEEFERNLNIEFIDLVSRPARHVCHIDSCEDFH